MAVLKFAFHVLIVQQEFCDSRPRQTCRRHLLYLCFGLLMWLLKFLRLVLIELFFCAILLFNGAVNQNF